MADLDVDHRQRHQGGGQKADPAAPYPLPQQVHHEHRSHVGHGRDAPADVGHAHQRAQVHEGLEDGPDANYEIHEQTAQGEPVRVEGTLVGVEEGSRSGYPRLGFRMFSDALAVARGLGEDPEHAVRAHVYGPFVGVKAEAMVPADSVKPQHQGHRQDQQEQR